MYGSFSAQHPVKPSCLAVSVRTAHNPDRAGAEKLRQPVMLPTSRAAEMAQRGRTREG